MKVLLLQPNYDCHVLHPPLGLGYLASSLEKAGHRVAIFDGTLKEAKTEDFLNEIKKFSPDLIGITVLSRGHNQTKELSAEIKKNFSIPIILGGSQVTAYPEKIIEDFGVDFVAVGEAEETLVELVESLQKKKSNFAKIKGLVFRQKDGKIKRTEDRPLVADLDKLPFPAWHLMPPADYRVVPILSPNKGYPVAPIVTSRGCPYFCTFCASNITWRHQFRKRSPKNIVDEIEMLVKKFGVGEIHLTDDNFTLIKEHAMAVCDELIKRNLNIFWQCPNGVRIDSLDLELLRKMRKAGCYSVGLGIESGSPQILKNVKKNLNLALVEEKLVLLKSVGIRAYGFFILGLPGETQKTVRETIDFAKKNPFDRVWFNILTPYPGSEIFEEYVKQQKLTFETVSWGEMDGNYASYKTAVPLKDLEKYQKKALREFYQRPKIIFDMITHTGFGSVKTFLSSRFFKRWLKDQNGE